MSIKDEILRIQAQTKKIQEASDELDREIVEIDNKRLICEALIIANTPKETE